MILRIVIIPVIWSQGTSCSAFSGYLLIRSMWRSATRLISRSTSITTSSDILPYGRYLPWQPHVVEHFGSLDWGRTSPHSMQRTDTCQSILYMLREKKIDCGQTWTWLSLFVILNNIKMVFGKRQSDGKNWRSSFKIFCMPLSSFSECARRTNRTQASWTDIRLPE